MSDQQPLSYYDQRISSEQSVSAELDQLSCDLLEQALDSLAEGEEIPVLVAIDDGHTSEIRAFSNDSLDKCLEAARTFVRSQKDVVRYVVVFDGDVEKKPDGDAETFESALILEFGERGLKTAWSGYLLYDGFGTGDDFVWEEPQPAGACPSLLS